jgi:hypothetical protein
MGSGLLTFSFSVVPRSLATELSFQGQKQVVVESRSCLLFENEDEERGMNALGNISPGGLS